MRTDFFRTTFFFCFLILAMTTSASAYWWHELFRRHPVSPSREYAIRWDQRSSNSKGEYPYRLTRNGEIVWTQYLPFKLIHNAVTDDGIVAAYVQLTFQSSTDHKSLPGIGTPSAESPFCAVVIRPDGTMQFGQPDEPPPARDRMPSILLRHSRPELLVDDEQDRFFVRLVNEHRGDVTETWLRFRLSDCAYRGTFRLFKKFDINKKLNWHNNFAQIVRGTPLILFQHYPRNQHDYKLVMYSLVDLSGKTVWTRKEPFEFLHGRIPEIKCLLGSNAPNHFAIRDTGGNMQTTYRVEQTGDPQRPWKVTETDRSLIPYLWELPKKHPRVELDLIEEHKLDVSESNWLGPLSDSGFDFNEDGSVGYFYRKGKERIDFVLSEPSGEIISRTPLGRIARGRYQRPKVAWLTGDNWFVIQSDTEDESSNDPIIRAGILNTADSSLALINDLHCRKVKDVDVIGKDNLIILARLEYKRYYLLCCDLTGKERWALSLSGESFGDAKPIGVTVTPEGLIAILDANGQRIHKVDVDGNYISSVLLPSGNGNTLNCRKAEITALPDEGYIVSGLSNGTAVVFDENLEVRKTIHPRHESGVRLGSTVYVRKAPDSRFWAQRAGTLYRLKDTGVVDRCLNTSHSDEGLKYLVDFITDQQGVHYALSSRNNSVFVFNPDGSLRNICRSIETTNSSNFRNRSDITVDKDGNVFVADVDKIINGYDLAYHRYSPEGRAMGFAASPVKNMEGQWIFVPGSNDRWMNVGNAVHLVGDAGTILRTIDRRQDGKRFDCIYGVGAAPDGSVAIMSSDRESPLENYRIISFYGPDGKPTQKDVLYTTEFQLKGISYNGRIAVLSDLCSLYFVVPKEKAIYRFTPPFDEDRKPGMMNLMGIRADFTPDGKELVVYGNIKYTIYRYAIPDRFAEKLKPEETE